MSKEITLTEGIRKSRVRVSELIFAPDIFYFLGVSSTQKALLAALNVMGCHLTLGSENHKCG